MWLRVIFAIAALVVIAYLLQPWWMPKPWYRSLHYRGGKPNPLTRQINSATAWLFSRGMLPQFLVSFETCGARTGRTHRVPLVVANIRGNRYVGSMLGEKVDWVGNIRATNGDAVLCYGPREEVTLREIPVNDRGPILKSYLARAPGARPHFDIPWDAPLSDFERVASRYPVFEVREKAARTSNTSA